MTQDLDREVAIETYCEREVGPFWGINDSGYRPDCGGYVDCWITVGDLLEYGPGPEWEAPTILDCPKCGTTLDWPQVWTLKEGEELFEDQAVEEETG